MYVESKIHRLMDIEKALTHGATGLTDYEFSLIDWEQSLFLSAPNQWSVPPHTLTVKDLQGNVLKTYDSTSTLELEDFEKYVRSLLGETPPQYLFDVNGAHFNIVFKVPVYGYNGYVVKADAAYTDDFGVLLKQARDQMQGGDEMGRLYLNGSTTGTKVDRVPFYFNGEFDYLFFRFLNTTNLEKINKINIPERVYCAGYPVLDYRDFTVFKFSNHPATERILARFLAPMHLNNLIPAPDFTSSMLTLSTLLDYNHVGKSLKIVGFNASARIQVLDIRAQNGLEYFFNVSPSTISFRNSPVFFPFPIETTTVLITVTGNVDYFYLLGDK